MILLTKRNKLEYRRTTKIPIMINLLQVKTENKTRILVKQVRNQSFMYIMVSGIIMLELR